MKQLVLTLFTVAGLAINGFCYSFGDLYQDVAGQSKVTILSGNYTPIYLYEFRADEKNRGGFFKPVYTLRFLEAGFGWRTPYRASQLGAVLGGGGVRFDLLFNELVTGLGGDVDAWTKAVIPRQVRPLWQKTRFGYLMGHDFNTRKFTDAVYAGLAFSFG